MSTCLLPAFSALMMDFRASAKTLILTILNRGILMIKTPFYLPIKYSKIIIINFNSFFIINNF